MMNLSSCREPSRSLPSPVSAALEALTVGKALPITFAFPWRPGPIGTHQRLGLATASMVVTTIDPLDAPVFASLWTPEGRLEVRRHGTTWLRPVLSPGSWMPISLDAIADAAASGIAWRDNPLLPHTGRNRLTFNLGDHASLRTIAKGDEGRIAQARKACLARAGELCSIDGIVHRTTEQRQAGMVTILLDEVEVGPACSLGDLDSTCVMDTIDCCEGASGRWFLGHPLFDASCDPRCRRGFVALADWLGALAGAPSSPPWSRARATSRWPEARELVLLACAMSEVSDGSATLRAAAALSAVMLTASRIRAAHQGDPCAFSDLNILLGALWQAEQDPYYRRMVLRYVGAPCGVVSDALSGTAGPASSMWAYVIALAIFSLHRETDAEVKADELATLQL